MTSQNTTPMQRFCRLPMPSYEQIFADANTILDEIISQFHAYRKPSQQLDTQAITLFLSHGTGILKNASILLKSKFVQVINLYLPKIKCSLDETYTNELVIFLCQSILNSSKSSLVLEFIRALANILHGIGPNLSNEALSLLLGSESETGVVLMYTTQQDWAVEGYAIQCLGNICIRTSSGATLEKYYIQICYAKLIEILRSYLIKTSNDVEHYKLINIALKSLRNVLSGITVNETIIEPEFIVTLLKIFLLYGMNDQQSTINRLIRNLPVESSRETDPKDRIYPSKKKEKSPMTKKVHAKKVKRQKKKCSNSDDTVIGDENYNLPLGFNWRQMSQPQPSSSESELSDTETGQNEVLKTIHARIRQNAAITIQSVLRTCDRRSRFSCWLILVPDGISNHEPSLLYSLTMEMSVKVRPFILMALMELIDGSKGFLDSAVHADNSSGGASARAFTPFSVKLNRSIHVLHDTLLAVLDQNLTDVDKDKVVKCLTLLILNSPYKKIGMDYLPDIIVSVSRFLSSREFSLVQSTLTCLAASMSVDPNNKRILRLLLTPNVPTKHNVENLALVDGSSVTSWLLSFCTQQLSVAAKENVRETRVSSECIQLITVMLRCFPVLFKRQEREKIIELCTHVYMFHADVTISCHTIKLFEEISKFFISLYEESTEDSEGCIFWRKMLTGAIPQYLHSNPEKPAKGQAAVCDWLSNIGSHFFSKLKIPNQIFIKTVLIGLSSNEHVQISAAAVRALGVIIDYEPMKEDIWFVIDVTRSLLAQLDNPSINVRLKAAWSLANLCDFIDKNKFLTREYPESMIIQLLQYATKAALDNEKVSSNGVRALGNIIKHFPREFFEKESFVDVIKAAIEALIKNTQTGPMKTRWNACYACKCIMQNKDLPLGNTSWAVDLYEALLVAMGDCKNFKVRISAASALASPEAREAYGNTHLFSKIWSESLMALKKSEELTDFTEFKHKENLQEHTIILLLHLLSLATLADLQHMRRDVQTHSNIFLNHCERCLQNSEKYDNETLDASINTSKNVTIPKKSEEQSIGETSCQSSSKLYDAFEHCTEHLRLLCKIDMSIDTPLEVLKTALLLQT